MPGRMEGGAFRIGLGEATGAVADLGVLVPLAASLILVNGLDPGAVLLGAGVASALAVAGPGVGGPSWRLPEIRVPGASAFGAAFFLLVVPQLPLTFGNAVVAVTDLAHHYFGSTAGRVTPTGVCLSCAAGNAMSGLLGGMPMCHGAGGLTAHVRLGARRAGMNLLLGSVLVGLGLFFGSQATAI